MVFFVFFSYGLICILLVSRYLCLSSLELFLSENQCLLRGNMSVSKSYLKHKIETRVSGFYLKMKYEWLIFQQNHSPTKINFAVLKYNLPLGRHWLLINYNEQWQMNPLPFDSALLILIWQANELQSCHLHNGGASLTIACHKAKLEQKFHYFCDY